MAIGRGWLLVYLYTVGVAQVVLVAVTGRSSGIDNHGMGGLDLEEARRQREGDRVWYLPGQPPQGVKFQHYAGYVPAAPHKALFYWFFEAQTDVPNKPLVLWLNGGPGCSSVAYGAAQELGPFLVRSNGTQLTLNNFSWNIAANMLFVEAPVGVGFSYTNKTEELSELGDDVTAEDSHAFLLNWFKRFPSFRSHDFYISGESYAGHYVPQLANLIHDKNKGSSPDSYINLKGFMIGNAVLNDRTDTIGFVEYAWSHAIISDQLYEDIVRECGLSGMRNGTINDKGLCSSHFRNFMDAYTNIDIYSIYSPVCSVTPRPKTTSALDYYSLFTSAFFNHDLWHKLPSGRDPCTEIYVTNYFNREDVQRALHANVTKLPYAYSTCSEVITKWNNSPDTVLDIVRKLLDAGLRIWVYSGDTDGRVPVTSTKYSIKVLGLGIKEKWRAWFQGSQVGGWVETHNGGLSFVTVRGAGHQVPAFAPHQALTLFSHFLSGTALPSSSSHS